MQTIAPLEVMMSADWIGGAASSALSAGMQAAVSPTIGGVMRFAELVSEAIGGEAEAVGLVMDLGTQFITAFQGGGAFSMAGVSLAAIQLLTGRLRYAIETGASTAKANALRSQWDIATNLISRRVRVAKKLPGGGNFSYTQPGWKKDYPSAAVPPIPAPVRKIKITTGKNKGDLMTVYRRNALFADADATPPGVEYKTDCFSLGNGGCELPDDAKVGMSLLTFPALVDAYGLPWGGAHLAPLAALLTTPTIIHMQQREAVVDAIEGRIRSLMRALFRIRPGPPMSDTDVTLWADGTYAEPPRGLRAVPGGAGVLPYTGAERLPWWKRTGDSAATPIVDEQWFALEHVSAAMRSLMRFRECRRSCLAHFAALPTDLQLAANPDDFTGETIAAMGGPYGKPPPPPKAKALGLKAKV